MIAITILIYHCSLQLYWWFEGLHGFLVDFQASSDGQFLFCSCGTKVNVLSIASGCVEFVIERVTRCVFSNIVFSYLFA